MRLTAVAQCPQCTNVLKYKVIKRNIFLEAQMSLCFHILNSIKGLEYANLYHHC